jgi:hypothetical protein
LADQDLPHSGLAKFAAAENCSVDELRNVCEASVVVLIQAARMGMNDAQFSLFAAQGLKGERLELFEKIYAEKGKELRNYVRDAAKESEGWFAKYVSLEWRLDCIIASKSLRNVYEPEYLLKLNLSDSKQVFMDSDYSTLKHLEYVLEEALRQANSKAAKRIGRI